MLCVGLEAAVKKKYLKIAKEITGYHLQRP